MSRFQTIALSTAALAALAGIAGLPTLRLADPPGTDPGYESATSRSVAPADPSASGFGSGPQDPQSSRPMPSAQPAHGIQSFETTEIGEPLDVAERLIEIRDEIIDIGPPLDANDPRAAGLAGEAPFEQVGEPRDAGAAPVEPDPGGPVIDIGDPLNAGGTGALESGVIE